MSEYLNNAVAQLGEDQHLRGRLFDRANRVLKNGIALYAVAMLCFAGALLSLFKFYIPAMKEHGEVLMKEISAILKTEHEPRREDSRFGMVATLLARTNSAAPEQPDTATVTAIGAREHILVGVQKLAEAALSGSASDEDLSNLARPAWDELVQIAGSRSDDGRQAWLGRVVPVMMSLRKEKDLPLIERAEGKKTLPTTHDDDFGPPGRPYGTPEGATRIIVSSLQNTDEWQTEFTASHRVRRAAGVGKLFGLAVDAAMPNGGSTCAVESSDTSAQLVQLYFVSVDNVLAIWQCRRATKFPASRMWAAQNYLEQLLSSNKPSFETKAYLDFGGFGVVRTKCLPILDRTFGAERFLGAVCGDLTVPISEVRSGVKDSHLVQVFELHVQLPDQNVVQGVQSVPPASLDDGRCRAIGKALMKSVEQLRPADASNATGIELLARNIIGLEIEDEKVETTWLFVPLGLTSPTSLRGLGVRSNVTKPPSGWLWTASALGVFAVVGVVLAADQSRRVAEGAIVGNLLRNLDVGIAITDAMDEIVGANERAEQILGVQLPPIAKSLSFKRASLGEGFTGTKYRFYELIDDEIHLLDERGQPEPAVPYRGVIPRQRRDNEASTYFARLAVGENVGEIIRVSAAPILSKTIAKSGDEEKWTFGIIELIRPPAKADAPPEVANG